MPVNDKERLTPDDEVLQRLAEIVGDLTNILQGLATENTRLTDERKSQSRDLEYFRKDLGYVRDAVARVVRVLHEGNGQRPLVTRVAVMEEKVDGLEEGARESKKKEIVDAKGKWALRVALVSGLLALATSLTTAIW
jgi:hypothetical protein